MTKGHLFLLTGTSGAGKTTVATALLERHSNLRRVVTYTTRAPREGEVNGVSYHFVDVPTFQQMIDQNAFLEWAQVYDNFYGETKASVHELLAEGHDVLLVLDPQGAKTIKASQFPCTAFFLDVASEELIRRLRGRGKDDEASLQKRIEAMTFDRSHQSVCDHVVQNPEGKIEETIQTIEHLMETAKS